MSLFLILNFPRRNVIAVVIDDTNKCKKLFLPNGKVVDVLSPVLVEMKKWIQDDKEKPESGGYIVGYQHEKTGNISLESISPPCNMDIKNRVHFSIRDSQHSTYLKRARRNKSFYMGVWHTHPQSYPIPSSIDWEDWKKTVENDKTGCQYVFFIIAGTSQWRLWIGDSETKRIIEGIECSKTDEGLYINEKQTI